MEKTYAYQHKRQLMFFSYRPNKKCPICHQPMVYHKWDDITEWIITCNKCRYRIRYIMGYFELRSGKFFKTINVHNKKNLSNYKEVLMAFGKAIRRESLKHRIRNKIKNNKKEF